MINKILKTISQEKTLVCLMLICFVCFIGTVYIFSGRSDLTRLHAEMKDTTDFVTSEYMLSSKFNKVIVMQDLDRIVDKVRHIQDDGRKGVTLDEAYLKEITEKLRISGSLLLNADGEVLQSFPHGGQVQLQLIKHLQNNVILEVGKYPLKIYADRIFLDDGSFIDFGAGGTPGSDRIIVNYYHTSSSFADAFSLDLQRLVSGFHTHLGSHVVIAKENKIIAVNEKDIAGADAKYGEIITAIKTSRRNIGQSDVPLKFSVGGENYYGYMITGRSFYVYQFVTEDQVFSYRKSCTIYAFLCGFIVMILILWSRQMANMKRNLREQAREAEYQRNLLAKAHEAEMANLAKTEFLRRMSHDIRTPINGIRGIVEIADHYKDDPDKQLECRHKIWEASGYLLELVNEVLEISKLESGKIVLENKPFNLRLMLQDIKDVVEKQAYDKDISITFTYKCKNDCFIGSPLYIKRTLMNIIGNAIMYNKKGGSVVVLAGEDEISTTQSRISLTCRDTGIGMSEEFQKKMFEPFSQEFSDARTTYSGTGLGLAIAKRVVEQMDGTISCDSICGEGTTFTVTLPMIIDYDGYQADSTVSEANIHGCNILLVEDNELNMEIAEFTITQAGAKVVKAVNGKEAVEIFAKSGEGEFDAILMDVMMPVMDGMEASRSIRSMDRGDAGTVPIIAMTANAFAEDRQSIIEAGMNEHITKPLDSRLVIATVANFVNK